jgi:pyruvate kinase
VATAIYDGADAVMLSAESASGMFPLKAVTMMDRILTEVESDLQYMAAIDASHATAQAAVADAVCASVRQATRLLPVAAIVTYTRSGYTSLRAARERLDVPVLCMTPELDTARRMALWAGASTAFTRRRALRTRPTW